MPIIKKYSRRSALGLSSSFVLTACSGLQETPERTSSRINLGTQQNPVFSTGETIKTKQQSWPRANEVVPDKYIQRLGKSIKAAGTNLSFVRATLNNAWSHGLDPTAYNLDGGTNDIASIIRYCSDARFGLTSPKFGKATSQLERAVAEKTLQSFVENAAPDGFLYQKLHRTALKSLTRHKQQTGNFRALQVTLEKLRRNIEPDLESRPVIVVNIAGFELQTFNNGKMELGSKVIVGQEGRDSPVGRDYISNLKFSPDWTIPASIIKRTFHKQLIEDPSQLFSKGFEVKVNGKIIDPAEPIDWANVKPATIGMRQPPGPNNVLGGVRFSLNNSNAIFLHDTTTPKLFDLDERANSSGCIRVQKSDELALWILRTDGQNDWTMDRVRAAMDQGETSYAKLRRRMNVELLYHQAWVDHTGVLRLGRDIYNRDKELETKLSSLLRT